MRIIQPNWVKHENKSSFLSIFSVDIHPDGTKFATGGQGNDCGRVAIWNLNAIINDNVQKDDNQPKLLCKIDSHLQCVNSVRWSHDGNYLASAGDDKLIMIWTLSGRYQGQTEQYKIVSTLRSHSGDILDLSWSNDDQLLASCSIDNIIVIWNTQRWPEITKILKGHCGLVKGVTWDPIGKYLASQSADKTLRVWRISDWSEEAVIKEPFEQCGDTTHVLRVSWSPDGQYLVSAQAMNNCGSVAKIIDRQDWTFARDFVGHRKAIPCARFNPNIFKRKADIQQNSNEKTNIKFKPQCICALGSRDRSISIWSTARPRPLVVIDDVFGNSVVDLSWSKSGYHLLACSVDGSVICFEFDEAELGSVYNQDERMVYLQQLYGNSLFSNKNSVGNQLIENIDILMLQNKKNADTQNETSNTNKTITTSADNKSISDKMTFQTKSQYEQVNTRCDNEITTNNNNSRDIYNPDLKTPVSTMKLTNSSPGRLAKGPTDKQIEILSSDGRRRIIPLYIPPTDAGIGFSSDSKNSQQALSITSRPITFSSSSESKSKIVIETLDETNPGQNLQAYQYLNSNSLPANIGSTLKQNSSFSQASAFENQCLKNEVDTKIAHTAATDNKSNLLNGNMNNQQQSNKSDDESSDDEIIIKRSKSLKKSKLNSDYQSSKRKPGRPAAQQDRSNNKNNYTQDLPMPNCSVSNELIAKNSLEKSIDKQYESQQPNSTVNDVPMMKSLNNQVNASNRNLYFPALKLPRKNHSSIKLFTRSDNGKIFYASIEYPLSSSGICKLTIFTDDQIYWNVMTSNPILTLAGSEEIVACFCDDHSINVFLTDNGRRLFVPIVLEYPVAKMICANKFYLLLITCNAHIWLWDFQIPKVLVANVSMAPLLIDCKTSEQLSIQNALVSSTAKPVVTISNGRTYIFENEIQSWCLINDLNDPLNYCTDLRPCATYAFKQLSYTKFPSRSLLNFFSSNSSVSQQSILSFMEKQIEVAKQLGSREEYRFWTLNLVQHLVSIHSCCDPIQSGIIENRLKAICTSLIGSRFPSRISQEHQILPHDKCASSLPDLNRHELLREVLSILVSNLSLQRLYQEFKDILDSFSINNLLNFMSANSTKNISALKASTLTNDITETKQNGDKIETQE